MLLYCDESLPKTRDFDELVPEAAEARATAPAPRKPVRPSAAFDVFDVSIDEAARFAPWFHELLMLQVA